MKRKLNKNKIKHSYDIGGVVFGKGLDKFSNPDFSEDHSVNKTTAKINNLLPVGVSTLEGIADIGSSLNKQVDTTPYDIGIDNLINQQFVGSNANLRAQSASISQLGNLTPEEEVALGKKNSGEITLDVASNILEGVSTGASTGNPYVTAGLGVFKGLTSAISNSIEQKKIREAIDKQNQERERANKIVFTNLNNAVNNTNASNSRNIYAQSLMNLSAFGGVLETNGANFPMGAVFIENGGTHEQNPNEGVQFGIASDGLPNLVEEGEVVIKVNDRFNQKHSFAEGDFADTEYVLSNRLVFDDLQEIIDAKITDKPKKYLGKSPAEAYKDIIDRNKIHEVPNRQDSKDYITSLNERFAALQETLKLRKEQESIMKALNKATPEQQDLILQQAGYPNLIEEAAYAANGGEIHIKPSKRGTFTAAAKKHGKSVQAFASQVLANKENYSPAMVKKANFARNFGGHKHAEGGYLVGQTYDVSEEEYNRLISLGYEIERV